jgi:hypothetical protein
MHLAPSKVDYGANIGDVLSVLDMSGYVECWLQCILAIVHQIDVTVEQLLALVVG